MKSGLIFELKSDDSIPLKDQKLEDCALIRAARTSIRSLWQLRCHLRPRSWLLFIISPLIAAVWHATYCRLSLGTLLTSVVVVIFVPPRVPLLLRSHLQHRLLLRSFFSSFAAAISPATSVSSGIHFDSLCYCSPAPLAAALSPATSIVAGAHFCSLRCCATCDLKCCWC